MINLDVPAVIINAMRPSRYYLSGPMTGIDAFNFPAFNEAAKELRLQGHFVFNPAETDGGDTSKPRAYYMRKDIEMVSNADGIVMLKGWSKSKGAKLELDIAKELGLEVRFYKDAEREAEDDAPESILQEAQRLVHGPRGDSYGPPHRDFERTAKIWSAILGIEVTASQACLCMIGVKISRQCNKPKRDNMVDAAGYAECVNMIEEAK